MAMIYQHKEFKNLFFFSGKRVTRGLYKTRENKLLNADVNGSFNTMKKVIPDVLDQGIKGLPFSPVVVDPLAFN